MATNQTTFNYVSEIWKIADYVRDVIRPADYNRLVLPFIVLRRLECALEPTRDAVCKAVAKFGDKWGRDSEQFCAISKKSFFNVTSFRLNDLGVSNTLKALEHYINGFSPNARAIFEEFRMEETCKTLDKKKMLYEVCKRFGTFDLSPEVVSDRTMSDIYEHLIQRYGEEIAQDAEDFMTPRDIVRLAVSMVFANDDELMNSDTGCIRTLYDGCAGTGGFISDALDLLDEWHTNKEMKAPAKIVPYGQELEGATWATGKANLLLRNVNGADELENMKDLSVNFKLGNTLSDDKFSGRTFNYQLTNPPYGKKWENEKEKVLDEVSMGYKGRFGAGCPNVDDGSMLFVQNVVSKLAPLSEGGGKAAIILSGSPLYVGDAGKGLSNIRRWLFHKDVLECIVRLPAGIFFRTGITTYIWIFSNNKAADRKGKILLIDASEMKSSMRKNLGNKRFEITEDHANQIVRYYVDGPDSTNTDVCKMVPTSDFMYRQITINRPLRMKIKITEDDKYASFLSDAKVDTAYRKTAKIVLQKYKDVGLKPYSWAEILAEEIRTAIKTNKDSEAKTEPSERKKSKKKSSINLPAKGNISKAIRAHFGIVNPSFDPVKDNDGNFVPDKNLSFKENVPWETDVNEYFKSEVLPYFKDAWIDKGVKDDDFEPVSAGILQSKETVGKVGTEISFNKYFLKTEKTRNLQDIADEIAMLDKEISSLMTELFS